MFTTRSAESSAVRTGVAGALSLLAAAALLVACGTSTAEVDETVVDIRGEESGVTSDTSDTSDTSVTETTPTTRVDGLDRAKQATVRIVARGSFVDPEFGERLNVPGSGSGFFVSEDGLVVTNNHVVTGAATLEVYVQGEDEPRNARVLGVSECNDLAVIDVDGDGFPFLEWRTDPVTSGLEIRAVGYPLGDAELTVLDGVVSKEDADGESDWASIDSVIETTADILPGNSGGPVVDDAGDVVGISYAGNNFDQAFAIGSDVAANLIDTLADGTDVDSIGINGYAVSTEDGSLTGIWVASVESGSQAQTAGIQGGDIITRLEGLVLATDGTMADYCDVLRTKGSDAPLSIEVLRFDTNTILTGTLPNELTEASLPGSDDDDGDTSDDANEYQLLFDDSGSLSLEVPVGWIDQLGAPWADGDETIGVAISAAPDRDAFFETWETPGVFFGASRTLLADHGTPDAYLDTLTSYDNSCDEFTAGTHDDGFYAGTYHLWEGCGSTDATLVRIAALPTDGDHLVYLLIQAVDEDDIDALGRILDTFFSDGQF